MQHSWYNSTLFYQQDKTVRHIVEKRLFNTLYYLLAHLDDFVYQMVHEIEGQNGNHFSREQGGRCGKESNNTKKDQFFPYSRV